MRIIVHVILAIALLLPALAAAESPEKIDIDTTRGRQYKLALNRSMKAIAGCYDDQLKKTPTLAGRVTVRVTVKPEGRTDSVAFSEDTLSSEAVNGCIQTILEPKTWPASDGAVYFETVLTFEAAPSE
jgi:hypothetical protein